jgi:hypothetical protein
MKKEDVDNVITNHVQSNDPILGSITQGYRDVTSFITDKKKEAKEYFEK